MMFAEFDLFGAHFIFSISFFKDASPSGLEIAVGKIWEIKKVDFWGYEKGCIENDCQKHLCMRIDDYFQRGSMIAKQTPKPSDRWSDSVLSALHFALAILSVLGSDLSFLHGYRSLQYKHSPTALHSSSQLIITSVCSRSAIGSAAYISLIQYDSIIYQQKYHHHSELSVLELEQRSPTSWAIVVCWGHVGNFNILGISPSTTIIFFNSGIGQPPTSSTTNQWQAFLQSGSTGYNGMIDQKTETYSP